jgi:hypothetical protein
MAWEGQEVGVDSQSMSLVPPTLLVSKGIERQGGPFHVGLSGGESVEGTIFRACVRVEARLGDVHFPVSTAGRHGRMSDLSTCRGRKKVWRWVRESGDHFRCLLALHREWWGLGWSG